MSQLGSMSGYANYYNSALSNYNAVLKGLNNAVTQQGQAGANIVGQYAGTEAAQMNLLNQQWQQAIPNNQQQMISKGLGNSTVLAGMNNQTLGQQSLAQNAASSQYAQGLAGVEAQQQAALQQAYGAYNTFAGQNALQQQQIAGQLANTQLGATISGEYGLANQSLAQGGANERTFAGISQQNQLASLNAYHGAPLPGLSGGGGGYMGSSPSVGAMQGALGGGYSNPYNGSGSVSNANVANGYYLGNGSSSGGFDSPAGGYSVGGYDDGSGGGYDDGSGGYDYSGS